MLHSWKSHICARGYRAHGWLAHGYRARGCRGDGMTLEKKVARSRFSFESKQKLLCFTYKFLQYYSLDLQIFFYSLIQHFQQFSFFFPQCNFLKVPQKYQMHSFWSAVGSPRNSDMQWKRMWYDRIWARTCGLARPLGHRPLSFLIEAFKLWRGITRLAMQNYSTIASCPS